MSRAGEFVSQNDPCIFCEIRGTPCCQSAFRCEGFDVFLADGQVAGQAIFHVHIHAIPRFAGDGFELTSPERRVHALMELRPASAALVEALGEDLEA